MSCNPYKLVSYLESYWSDLDRRLLEGRIDMNVCKSIAMLFSMACRHIQMPHSVLLFGEPMLWVDKARCLDVTLYTRLKLIVSVGHLRQVIEPTAKSTKRIVPNIVLLATFRLP